MREKHYTRLGYHLRQLIAYPVLGVTIALWMLEEIYKHYDRRETAKKLEKISDKLFDFCDVIKMRGFQEHIKVTWLP